MQKAAAGMKASIKKAEQEKDAVIGERGACRPRDS